jgi:amino acid transporter
MIVLIIERSSTEFFLFYQKNMSDELILNIKKAMINLGVYTGALIIGPLILFGSIGYLLDYYLKTKPVILVISVFVAFIFTNIFLYKKVKKINKLIKKQSKMNRKDNIDNEA